MSVKLFAKAPGTFGDKPFTFIFLGEGKEGVEILLHLKVLNQSGFHSSEVKEGSILRVECDRNEEGKLFVKKILSMDGLLARSPVKCEVLRRKSRKKKSRRNKH